MPSVRVHNLGKRYKVYARPSDRLREWLPLHRRRLHNEAWVLRGVTFAVEPGEALGIFGHNGAGKSTLLRIIRGTIRATEGHVETIGRVAAIELGLGFHPEFTGRDNLFVAGALIGLDGDSIRALMPAIETFAEIGDAIDEPVRTYSTGMQMRLAFSLATAVRPEILLIDESLAVGDAYFSHKCMTRIRKFRREGTTLLLVSHDPVAVKSLCDRAILLEDGLLVREGSPQAVLDYYNAWVARMKSDHEIRQGEQLGGRSVSTRSGNRHATIEEVEILCKGKPTRTVCVGDLLEIEVSGRCEEDVDDLTAGFAIRDRFGNEVFGTNTHQLQVKMPPLSGLTRFRVYFEVPANLGVGSYSLTVALHAGAVHLEGNYDWWDHVRVFRVFPAAGCPVFVGCAYLPVDARIDLLSGDS